MHVFDGWLFSFYLLPLLLSALLSPAFKASTVLLPQLERYEPAGENVGTVLSS